MNISNKTIVSKTMISIAGIFYYSKSNIVLDIFSELVMNNNYVSKYLKIDENDKLNKKKSQLYLYYRNEKGENLLTCNLTNQVIQGVKDPLLNMAEYF